MKPSDLNLPPKFADWKFGQKSAILAAACSDKRFVIINAPTGIGKTAIGMGISSLLGRTLYLTMTKPLQGQLMGDFSPMGLKELKGQNNYPCLYFDDGHRKVLPACDEGPCHAGIECELRDQGCRYYDAVRTAAKSNLVVENYVHWMTLNRYSEPDSLGKFDCLICDEAHETNNALADFVRVDLDRITVRKLVGVDLPFGASMEEWVEWATEEGLPRVRARIESAKATTAMFAQGISVVKALNNLEGNISAIARARSWKRTDAADPAVWTPGTSNDWVVEEDDDKISFQPVWASGYAEDYIFNWIPKVILLSATVTRRDAYYLGIGKNQLEYLQYPSPFHRKRRPLFVVPTVALKQGMAPGETKIWLKQIDRIVEKEAVNRKLKGIIHAVSYDRAKLIKAHSIHSSIMIVHDRRNLRETVEKFKAMPGPAVLISPSVGTGYDFPGRDCVHPTTKVLTVDLRWVCAGDLNKGDKLLAFDEEGHTRSWRESKVISTCVIKRQSYRTTFSDGTEIISSADHMWLSRRGHDTRWIKTKNMKGVSHPPFGGTKVYKLLDTWRDMPARDSGYLAAAFDGEGLSLKTEDIGTIRPYVVEVVSNEPIGLVDVVALGTSTKTFIAAGLCSHNCRFQIVAKIPFIDPRPKITRLRTKLDRNYPLHVALVALIQMVGRGVRSSDDWCRCVAPGTKVLTGDLRWVPAETLEKGDRLLSLDEVPPTMGMGYSRKWRWSFVEATHKIIAPRVRITMTDVVLICTPNHPVLVRGQKGKDTRRHKWKEAAQLRPGDQVIRFLPVWDETDSREAGWLAGFTDGEGCLTLRSGDRNPSVLGITISQSVGPTLDRMSELLRLFDFGFNSTVRKGNPPKHKGGRATRPHHTNRIHGGIAELLRFLGQIRPLRLLNKWSDSERHELAKAIGVSKVVSVDPMRPGPIISLQTSTRTYMTEGFCSHNTYLIDDNWYWFSKATAKMMPRWFRSAIRRVNRLSEVK